MTKFKIYCLRGHCRGINMGTMNIFNPGDLPDLRESAAKHLNPANNDLKEGDLKAIFIDSSLSVTGETKIPYCRSHTVESNLRKIFKDALDNDATGIALARHKGEAELKPTMTDELIKEKTTQIGNSLGIHFIDYFIFKDSYDGEYKPYYSMQELRTIE